MIKLLPSDVKADNYLLTAVKLDSEDTVYVMLLRIYDNGFLTSAGFKEYIYVEEEEAISPIEVLCLYNTLAGDWLPLDWRDNGHVCFVPSILYLDFLGGQLEEGVAFYRGHITAIDFGKVNRCMHEDCPVLTDDAAFTSDRGEQFAFVAL